MPTRVSVAEGVLEETADGPRLKGSRCIDCGTFAFPAQKSCQRCSGTNIEPSLLADKGVLWTFTIQGFPPKSPPYRGNADLATFVPFGVGYVELPGEVKVETRLTESDPSKLHIGMEVRLVIVPLRVDPDGTEVMMFAFEPV